MNILPCLIVSQFGVKFLKPDSYFWVTNTLSGALFIISVTRSGAEMEERSRELFTMLRCVIHHQCNAERSGAGNGERIKYCNFAMWKCFTLQHCDAERKCTNLQRSGAGYGEIILQWGSALTFNIVTRTGASGTGDG